MLNTKKIIINGIEWESTSLAQDESEQNRDLIKMILTDINVRNNLQLDNSSLLILANEIHGVIIDNKDLINSIV